MFFFRSPAITFDNIWYCPYRIGKTAPRYNLSPKTIERLKVMILKLLALCSLLSFLLFAFPHQTFYEAPALITAELYANSVLTVLNSRIRITGGWAIRLIQTMAASVPQRRVKHIYDRDRVTTCNENCRNKPRTRKFPIPIPGERRCLYTSEHSHIV
ncbi:hypothetical protein ARMGADRAFT_530467 [Armillaria gallica]|uniref:DUF6534 domain-containing protein n=1 Tax=Armillaria gallica TaxID=47427 RepID=A0A2H3CYI0_ARMGA|nr:hypothetical protein ARMGADRAFT_530467 [Armillaria gallica]